MKLNEQISNYSFNCRTMDYKPIKNVCVEIIPNTSATTSLLLKNLNVKICLIVIINDKFLK